MHIRPGRLEGDTRDKDPIHVLREGAFEKIAPEVYERLEDRAFGVENPLKTFYDAVIGLIVDLLGPENDELVIVFNGELCFTPWAVVIESVRIRTVPSLTSYQFILSVPESHHKKTGTLLV